MMSRRLQCLRTVVMAVACIALAGSPAWANSNSCNYGCYCQGVDNHGCLSNYGGDQCTAVCVLNTKSCSYTTVCRGGVKNYCHKSQCYKNCWFLQKCHYSCSSSYYTCDQYGDYEYTCGGNTQG
jgi:hypothetical protein